MRCSYCDSVHAFEGGRDLPVAGIVKRAKELGSQIVTVTGGEPLLQDECPFLIESLADEGFKVLVETAGSLSIAGLDPRSVVILDLKCPSSGECERNEMANLEMLPVTAEVKFVIGSIEDYEWAKRTISEATILTMRHVLFSYAYPPENATGLKPIPHGHHSFSISDLADRIVEDRLNVRLIPQLHKAIWPMSDRGR